MVQPMRPLVVCGPSGSGKSSLLRLLFEEFPDKFGFSVSHTTRSPRPGELDGKHYHFTTVEEMKSAIDRGEFIESATFSNNMYGTSKAAVAAVQSEGKICVLDIDVQGVKQIKQTDLDPLYVFIKPPSMEELEKRLRDRNTETEESLQRRLATAQSELPYGEAPGNFHLILVNDVLEKAYSILQALIVKELITPRSNSVAADWCCLGSSSTDHNSGDYYYRSTNNTTDNADVVHLVPSVETERNFYTVDQAQSSDRACQSPIVDHSKGDGYNNDNGCDTETVHIYGGGCDSGMGADSGGCFDSGGDCGTGGGCDD